MATLYKISNFQKEGNTFSGTITFDPSHPVFAGHFPGKPVVPGVVMVEIAGMAASLASETSLIIKQATVIKFLNMVDPQTNPVISLKGSIIMEDEDFKSDFVFFDGETIFMKIKGMKFMREA